MQEHISGLQDIVVKRTRQLIEWAELRLKRITMSHDADNNPAELYGKDGRINYRNAGREGVGLGTGIQGELNADVSFYGSASDDLNFVKFLEWDHDTDRLSTQTETFTLGHDNTSDELSTGFYFYRGDDTGKEASMGWHEDTDNSIHRFEFMEEVSPTPTLAEVLMRTLKISEAANVGTITMDVGTGDMLFTDENTSKTLAELATSGAGTYLPLAGGVMSVGNSGIDMNGGNILDTVYVKGNAAATLIIDFLADATHQIYYEIGNTRLVHKAATEHAFGIGAAVIASINTNGILMATGKKITNLANGTATSDAATVGQSVTNPMTSDLDAADHSITNLGSIKAADGGEGYDEILIQSQSGLSDIAKFQSTDTDTAEGLDMLGNHVFGLPVADSNGHAVEYSQLADYLPLAGGTMDAVASIDMNDGKIGNLSEIRLYETVLPGMDGLSVFSQSGAYQVASFVAHADASGGFTLGTATYIEMSDNEIRTIKYLRFDEKTSDPTAGEGAIFYKNNHFYGVTSAGAVPLDELVAYLPLTAGSVKPLSGNLYSVWGSDFSLYGSNYTNDGWIEFLRWDHDQEILETASIILRLDHDNTGAGVNTGINFNRGSSAANDAAIIWNEVSDQFNFEAVHGSVYAPLSAAYLKIWSEPLHKAGNIQINNSSGSMEFTDSVTGTKTLEELTGGLWKDTGSYAELFIARSLDLQYESIIHVDEIIGGVAAGGFSISAIYGEPLKIGTDHGYTTIEDTTQSAKFSPTQIDFNRPLDMNDNAITALGGITMYDATSPIDMNESDIYNANVIRLHEVGLVGPIMIDGMLIKSQSGVFTLAAFGSADDTTGSLDLSITLNMNDKWIAGVEYLMFDEKTSDPTAGEGAIFYKNNHFYGITSAGAVQLDN